jgi:hypothetical protein
MKKTLTSLLMASALMVASTAAVAAPKNDRGGTVTVNGTMVSVAFVNRGDCQSTTAKLRNGIRGLAPLSSSTENAVTKPLRNVICENNGVVIDLANQALTEAEIAAILNFIDENLD